jgi:hypothetical protein
MIKNQTERGTSAVHTISLYWQKEFTFKLFKHKRKSTLKNVVNE